MNKKGISAIVATVLIILITVAAVTIIWAAIIPMINSQLSKGTVCLDAVSEIKLSDVGYTCWEGNSTSGEMNVSLQVKHGAKPFDLADVQVIVSDDSGNSHTYYISDVTTTWGYSVGDKVPFPDSNEEKVYTINTSHIGVITKVDIAPVVKIGKGQEACSISASKDPLQKCAA